MHNVVVFISKHPKTERQQMLSGGFVRMLATHIAPIIVIQQPTTSLEELAQDIVEEIEQKICELKKNEFQTIQNPKMAIFNETKQYKYRERYMQNQINNIYLNHKKIYFNRTKCK